MKAETTIYSIIVPVYGVEKFLKKCIESLITQTYTNIEIILVDDGSKDNSGLICDNYALQDQRIKVLHKKNGGLISARKTGAEIATGSFLFCVDGDDWISSNYIQAFHDIIIRYNPDIVCCGYIKSDDNVMSIKFPIGLDSGFYNQEQMEETIYPIAIEGKSGKVFPSQLWAKAFRRDLYLAEQNAVDNLIKIGEDGAVVKPLITKSSSLYVMHECLYYYRFNENSMTHIKSHFDPQGPELLYKHLRNRIDCKEKDYEYQINRRFVKDLYILVASYFKLEENFWSIRKKLISDLKRYNYYKTLNLGHVQGCKNRLQMYCMQHQFFFILYLISKFKI